MAPAACSNSQILMTTHPKATNNIIFQIYMHYSAKWMFNLQKKHQIEHVVCRITFILLHQIERSFCRQLVCCNRGSQSFLKSFLKQISKVIPQKNWTHLIGWLQYFFIMPKGLGAKRGPSVLLRLLGISSMNADYLIYFCRKLRSCILKRSLL